MIPRGRGIAFPPFWSRRASVSAAVAALALGFLIAFSDAAVSVSIVVAAAVLLAAFGMRHWWRQALWVAVTGLALFSYGFNNVPLLVLPVPLVDLLVVYAVFGSFPVWWRLRKDAVIRRLLAFNVVLSTVVSGRLIVDSPRFGLLAVRDALFALELWSLFPAVAAGYLLGEERLRRRLMWLFSVCTAWFLFYPLRDLFEQWSPVVGIQRPVPLLAFTTAGFLAVPAVFWFWRHARGLWASVGIGTNLLVLLFVQSRGAYLALFLSGAFALLWSRPQSWRMTKLAVGLAVALLGVSTLGSLPGRLGVPAGLGTAWEQFRTLIGEEGAGAGSYRHRLEAWPLTVAQVLEDPLGPLVGVGLGEDLFQGFTIEGGVLVRKPHNDFLEIWARTGLLGLVPWLSVLVVLAICAFAGARRQRADDWILALQVTLWITAFSQPAFGFAYTTVTWAVLTGFWLGSRIRRTSAGGTASTR